MARSVDLPGTYPSQKNTRSSILTTEGDAKLVQEDETPQAWESDRSHTYELLCQYHKINRAINADLKAHVAENEATIKRMQKRIEELQTAAIQEQERHVRKKLTSCTMPSRRRINCL
ncbi:hypothetical protein PHISCL_06598 [Aspergillus sclerotialis]|uniref:Uncharacterized protein n=1 Tax=Aspergillus sclerotialis TaxID=2070753 RepID=A0A3A2ZD24_9EURO|nr:hypothetical protein PHISCL_06598 [Aspergillus sclerotialis]